ncbi:hypothetical protein K3N28_10060 [Glycomyces sp. TRM65418]|uniref:hypothetical protein n=1 Tax=Glycomyces sp. TRM65418 TaxID=2867006 RepID=UPI001CE5749E|nr:hypothetical protein [Glycomyces sp. TRM65418]MCC3763416.1 hypothetical protein [Glycomyces sp. TRM65418]QZD57407.1 hypothetical protein K3N28_10000 [Glycomyces sp. TRM65418]
MEHERGNMRTADPGEDGLRQQSAAVAQEGRAEAREVADTAREQGRQLADEAKTQVRNVAEDAKEQLREQIASQTTKATESLRSLGEQVSALAQGRPEEAGPLTDYTQAAAERLRSTADRVQDQGIDGLLEDTKQFARRRPAAFLFGAALAGFAVGRLLRGGGDAHKQHSESEQHRDTGGTPEPQGDARPTGTAAVSGTDPRGDSWPTGPAAAGGTPDPRVESWPTGTVTDGGEGTRR